MNTENTEKILALPISGVGRIGRYQLLDCLATGGMAQVFLALSGELSGFRTLVVVKRILPHLSSDKTFIRMFFDEARLAALLDHPNVVRIIEVGQDGDEYFLAMEAVQGRSLSSLLRRGVKRDKPLTHAQSAFIVAQAANGLGYAHDLSDADGRPLEVVHRDVSPQNILVSFDGSVKVIDFGVARAMGRATETRAGGIKGKIHYMSPEQAIGGHVDRRSDVFALGIVLWEALCGRRLFRRDSEPAALRAIIDEPIPFPSEVVRISPRLERIVMKALEKDPAHRFKTAEEMALALERHAFTTEGFNPTQIGTTMKGLFASDHARWKKTVAAARDLQGAPEQWTNTSGTFLRPQSIDLHTRGSTVALRPRLPPPRSSASASGTDPDTPSDVASADSVGSELVEVVLARRGQTQRVHRQGVQTQRGIPLERVPGGRGRTPASSLIGGLGLLMVAAVLFVFAFSPLPTMTTIRIVANRLSPPQIEPLPPAPTPAPPTAAAAARPIAQIVHAGVVPPAPVAAIEPNADVQPEPPQQPPPLKAAEVALPIAGAKAPSPSKYRLPWPAPRPQRATQPPRAAKKVAHHPPRPAAAPGAANPSACTITVGSRPWSELWIDGRRTGRHTPYTGDIACGRHDLTFKRPDLDIIKSATVTLYPGEPFKESFALE